MRSIYLPVPEPVADPAKRCRPCRGRGVTGEQFAIEAARSAAANLIVDVLCGGCGGCGQARHETCTASQHIGWQPGDADDGEPDPDSCLSCHGRKWSECQAASDTDVVVLRIPCACAQPDMVEVVEPAQDPAAPDVMGLLRAAVASAQLVAAVAMAASQVAERKPPIDDAQARMRAMMDDPNLFEAWGDADDVARVCALVVYAQRCVEHGVLLAGDGPHDRHHLIAAGAVEMAAADLAEHPGQPLIPEQPGVMPRGRAGAFASSWICDSTEPDINKIRALCLLAAADNGDPGAD